MRGHHAIAKIRGSLLRILIRFGWAGKGITHVNLCGGPVIVPGFFTIDIHKKADLYLDLERHLLPFSDHSLHTIICISAINYFTRERGEQIIRDIYRTLKPGGIARFATQDLEAIAQKYVERDGEFFFQKRTDGSGRDRFPGETFADKFNTWFYGYPSIKGTGGKYFYDYETLALLFQRAGFSRVERKAFCESQIPHIEHIDNRPDQMFFLEAIK